MSWNRWRVALALSLVLVQAAWAVAEDGVFVLVRHAEKVDDSRDPELSAQGKDRAARLAEMLADTGVTSIYSTDRIRTRDTAAPLAARLDIDVTLYDGRELDELARELTTAGGRVLVVGHSNTTPELVRLIGGDPGPAIPEDEYDRMYVVVLSGGRSHTVVLRF